MKPSDAYKALVNKVNIEFYVGPHIARVIKQACEDKPEKKIIKKAPKKVSKD